MYNSGKKSSIESGVEKTESKVESKGDNDIPVDKIFEGCGAGCDDVYHDTKNSNNPYNGMRSTDDPSSYVKRRGSPYRSPDVYWDSRNSNNFFNGWHQSDIDDWFEEW